MVKTLTDSCYAGIIKLLNGATYSIIEIVVKKNLALF